MQLWPCSRRLSAAAAAVDRCAAAATGRRPHPLQHLCCPLQAVLLAATLMIGHALSRARVTWIGEAGVALLLGVAVGGLLLSPLFDTHGTFSTYMGFSKQFFFLAILPPIIFEAGWR